MNESYTERVAREAREHFDRSDITAAWVRDVESQRGVSIWEIDRWIWRRLQEIEVAT